MTEREHTTGEPGEDRLLDHEYDGIREYDNPMPRWWLATFWVTIIFSALYALNLPGIGAGRGWLADYDAEMAVADSLAALNDPMAGLTNEQLLAAAGDPVRRALGATTYTSMCASCHLADGGGLIGPNLVDGYWIHGGTPLEILNTVMNGVPAKGMPAWGKMLKPDQLTAVTAYVVALKGTTPAQPKAPEGINVDSAARADSGR